MAELVLFSGDTPVLRTPLHGQAVTIGRSVVNDISIPDDDLPPFLCTLEPASMGYRGQPNHPAVQQVILDGIACVRAAGKAAGILSADPVQAQRYLDAGALFVAVGVDTSLLVKAATALARQFKPAAATTSTATPTAPAASGPY